MFNNLKLEKQSKDINADLRNILKDKKLEKKKIELEQKIHKANKSERKKK
ncbi:hypothetical protein [Lactococcus petauri]|nr:hypothetical protein [Lactococcus petauri]